MARCPYLKDNEKTESSPEEFSCQLCKKKMSAEEAGIKCISDYAEEHLYCMIYIRKWLEEHKDEKPEGLF